MNSKDKNISLRTTENVYSALRSYKKETGLTQSQIVHFILEMFFFPDEVVEMKFKEYGRNAEAIFNRLEVDIAMFEQLASEYRKMSYFLDDVRLSLNDVIKSKREFENELRETIQEK